MNAFLWARACMVSGVATALGTAAHTTAGGLLPSPIIVAAVFVTLLVIGAAALTAPASYVRILALVGGGQAAVHLVLTMTAGHVAPHAPTATRPSPGALRTRSGGFVISSPSFPIRTERQRRPLLDSSTFWITSVAPTRR